MKGKFLCIFMWVAFHHQVWIMLNQLGIIRLSIRFISYEFPSAIVLIFGCSIYLSMTETLENKGGNF